MIKGRNDQGAKRPGAKCLGGETSRGGSGLGAKRLRTFLGCAQPLLVVF